MMPWRWTLLACALGLGLGFKVVPWLGSTPEQPATGPALTASTAQTVGFMQPAPPPPEADLAILDQRVDSGTLADWPIQDSDTTPLAFPLDQQKLDRLLARGTLTLTHPQGGSMQLQLIAMEQQGRLQLLRLQIAGIPGQVTRSANGFFGTLATDRGVYSIENHGLTTHIVNQQQLDQRTLPGFSDARTAPSS
ncbi:MAG: hypothetical protein ACR2PZ_08530 [Pseudomonadales bacterium]